MEMFQTFVASENGMFDTSLEEFCFILAAAAVGAFAYFGGPIIMNPPEGGLDTQTMAILGACALSILLLIVGLLMENEWLMLPFVMANAVMLVHKPIQTISILQNPDDLKLFGFESPEHIMSELAEISLNALFFHYVLSYFVYLRNG